jgi:hypothetical protein
MLKPNQTSLAPSAKQRKSPIIKVPGTISEVVDFAVDKAAALRYAGAIGSAKKGLLAFIFMSGFA